MTANLKDTGATVETAADPTVVAAAEKEAAMAHFSRAAGKDGENEETPEWREAQERYVKASQDYASAPVASLAGAALKVRKLAETASLDPIDADAIDTVIAYLDGAVPPRDAVYFQAGAALAVVDLNNRFAPPVLPDPAVEAAAERDAATAHFDGMGAETAEDEQRPEWKDALAKLRRAEDRFASAPVTSLAGAAVKIKALLQEARDPLGNLDGFHSTAIILETLSAFLDGEPGSEVPDPVAELANRLGAIVLEYQRLDAGPPGKEVTERMKALSVEMDKLIEALSRQEASSLAGALAQIMWASGDNGLLQSSEFSEEDTRAYHQRIERFLYSAIAVLEKETGIDRVTLGAEYCMPEQLNPFRKGATQ